MFILTYWPSEFINPQITASQPSPLRHARLFTSTLSTSGWIELWDKAASGMWADAIVWRPVWGELKLRTAGAKVKGHLLDPLSHPPLFQPCFLFFSHSFFLVLSQYDYFPEASGGVLHKCTNPLSWPPCQLVKPDTIKYADGQPEQDSSYHAHQTMPHHLPYTSTHTYTYTSNLLML